MGKTSHQQGWEKQFSWIQQVNSDIYRAYCKLCLKTSRIDGSGISQVKSHEKYHKSKVDNNQRTFVVRNGQTLLEPKGTLFLSPVDQVVKAEILQVLHFSSSNYSFACAQSDNERFSAMFPDPEIAKTIISRKRKSSIIFSTESHHIRKMLIYDVNELPLHSNLTKPSPYKQRNSMMGTCSLGLKDTTKLLMLTAALFSLATALMINC